MELKRAEARHAGRPRERRVDEAILGAALGLFLERGYQATGLTQVAKKAGVGTPAIYRRWHDKAALAIEVVSRVASEEPIAQTSSIRDDLVEYVRSRIRSWRTPVFHRVLVPLMSESLVRADLNRAIADRYRRDMRPLVARVQQAIDAGELTAVGADLILDLLGGPVAVPLLFNQPLPEEPDAEAIVDAVLSGVAGDKAAARH